MVPDDHIEFLQAVWTRRPVFTYVFFGLNILIFLLMAFAGGSTNESTLIAFGVKANSEIARGQWWRFITPIFIHIGFLHLLFNSYALWIVGPQVEKLYGPARFVILYLLTGMAGVTGSYLYHPLTISAGASGAIFGLFGVLLVFGIRYRNSIPPAFKRAVGVGVLPVILLNIGIGLSIPFIDNAAHIGGLLAGAALAAIVPFQKPGEETAPIFGAVQMLLLATIVVSFYEVATHYDGPNLSLRFDRSLPQVSKTSSATVDFTNALGNAERIFQLSVRDLQAGRIDRLASLRAETTKSIDQLRNTRSIAPRSDELTAALLRVMQDQYELIKDVERAGTVTFSHSVHLKENVRTFAKIMADFAKWVETDGSRYGLEKRKDR